MRHFQILLLGLFIVMGSVGPVLAEPNDGCSGISCLPKFPAPTPGCDGIECLP